MSKGQNDTVNHLKELGLSLYRIHKELRVSYNSVFLWDKGMWNPNEDNQIKLDELIERVEKGKRNGKER